MAQGKRPVWSPRSKQDLREIGLYFARAASPEIAEKILHDVDETARHLLPYPLRWRTRDELMPGLRGAIVHPYTVFYRVSDDRVEIVRVLHERRNFAAIFASKNR